MYSYASAGRQLGMDPIIEQIDGIVAWLSLFLFVAEAGTIAGFGFFYIAGFEPHLAGDGLQ